MTFDFKTFDFRIIKAYFCAKLQSKLFISKHYDIRNKKKCFC
jgi:hypothetical protein